jgi:alkylated DNA repair dioxygenase AlkB
LRRKTRSPGAAGHHYLPGFVSADERAQIMEWLSTLRPLWEQRFSKNHPPPPGQKQRGLLRPVYWLGNWQFACLDYYRPPHGVHGRCMHAEPFPAPLAALRARIEALVHEEFDEADVPRGWHLNTCLVNFYGRRGKEDTARVGEHKDFEPGPVASISLGERALFQFVRSTRPGEREEPVLQTWLEDRSLQIFGGERWKKHYFHRVQRVEDKGGFTFPLHVEGFETRRVNFTFRYVPDEHVVPYARLPPEAQEDIREYVEQLARHSPFFAEQLK